MAGDVTFARRPASLDLEVRTDDRAARRPTHPFRYLSLASSAARAPTKRSIRFIASSR